MYSEPGKSTKTSSQPKLIPSKSAVEKTPTWYLHLANSAYRSQSLINSKFSCFIS